MAKLKLQPDPTFRAKVGIPVAGGDAVEVEFTFKHRTREGLDKFIAEAKDMPDPDAIMAMASAWELEDAFTKDNVTQLAQNYIGAPRAIFDKYVDELVNARLGN